MLSLMGCNSDSSSTKFQDNTKFEKRLSNNDKSNMKYLDVSDEEGSISYGILDSQGNPETKGIYYLNDGEKLTKYITIKNYLGKPIQATLLMLNNYEQKEFLVDGDNYLTKEIYINNKTEIQIPIELNDFHKGYNDIVFVIAIDTKDFLDSEVQEVQPNLVTLRFSLFNQNDTIPQYNVETMKSWDESCFLNIHPITKKNILYSTQDVNVNEKLNVLVSAGNNTEKNGDFAFIVFEDWKQKSINNNKYILVNIPLNKSISIPTTFVYSNKGHHDISAILINDVYNAYNMKTSDIDSSYRLRITVK